MEEKIELETVTGLKTVKQLLDDKEFILNEFDIGDLDWYNEFTYKDLVKNENIKLGLEIGSHVGQSANDIIKSFKHLNLICIDVWDLSLFNDAGYDIPNIDNVYEQFLSNIVHYGIDDRIIPIKMSSEDASKIINDKFDFCYIDAEHSEEALYNDLCNWYPKLNENGFMCGDDWILKVIKWPSKEWDECINTESHEYDLDQRDFENTLRKGVKRFAEENNLNIFSIQNFWWLEK
jgi:hypothetical protein